MSRYRRLWVPGAAYFFTVNLAERGRSTLVDNIEVLRAAYRATVADHPVHCDAMVVLSDHIHAVLDHARGGCGLFRPVGRDQGAVYARIA